MEENMEKYIKNILGTAVKVITNPVGFYREMPKTGGLIEPLIFAVALGLVSGVVTAILSIFSLGSVSSFLMGLASIILFPIIIAICSFIGAAIIYILWKIMGSQEPYETAYRCTVYATAITPITLLLLIIPYLGLILSLAWGLFLTVTASTEVHKINQKTALKFFGIIFIVIAIFSISLQFCANRAQKSLGQYQNMTPEEAGKAFGKLMKSAQEEAEKNK
jgi:hypothetical protein